MSGFLYYLPNHSSDTIKHEQLVAAGLGYAFENPGSKQCAPLHGAAPGGSGGAIVFDPARVERHAYRPESQTWVQNEIDGFWVGMWNDDKPGPQDLLRTKTLSGELVTLADEQQWLIPYGRRWSERDDPELWLTSNCVLPCPLRFGGPGRVLVSRPFERYAHLWVIAEADRRLDTQQETEADRAIADLPGAVFSAVSILQANYVVGTAEIEMLEMFSQESPRQILDVFGDWATWRDIVEKKTASLPPIQPAGPRSSNGQEEDCPATAQP